MIKKNLAFFILFLFDIFAIYVSIACAFYTRSALDIFFGELREPLQLYTSYVPLYGITLAMFFYAGIYTKRYDFWHESRQIIHALFFSFLLIVLLLSFSKSFQEHSRLILVLEFLYMMLMVPMVKNILKKKLFKIGLWRKEAKIYGNDIRLKKEIFQNPYLGYCNANSKNAQTVFIDSHSMNQEELEKVIARQILTKREVIFIPLINEYNFTQSKIYELSNARINLITFQNNLKSQFRLMVQSLSNYIFALLMLPLLLPLIGVLAILIKKESSGPVFFAHNRIGRKGKVIPTLKFRSMYSDAKERLEKILAEDENAKKEWESSFKLKNDPRITKIGRFLRKTSLDELPQIFNVLKGEMNFVGPRPVVQEELDLYYKEDAEYYLTVKPGITGLWQVSGRSDTDYNFRVSIDKWYVRNWSLWLDVVILLKTIKVVLFREGAY